MKRCLRCRKTKPLKDFYRDRQNRDGLRGDCKTCHAKRRRGGGEHPEKYREVAFRRKLRSNYGLTHNQYRVMWQAQAGKCAVCRCEILQGPVPDRKSMSQYACVDHDHQTGVVRALLCQNCNQGIGRMGDSPSRLEKAAAYLRYHGIA